MNTTVLRTTFPFQPYAQGITLTQAALQGDGDILTQRSPAQAYPQLTQAMVGPTPWYTYTTTSEDTLLRGASCQGMIFDEYVEEVERPEPITNFSKWLEKRYGSV